MSKEKRRYISYKADHYLRDKFLTRAPRRSNNWTGESFVRAANLCRFFLVCGASLFQALAPWMLSAIEIISVLTIYFLGTSRSLVLHQSPAKYHFRYTHSMEDVVGMACIRAGILSLTYGFGALYFHRPYVYCSYFFTAVILPYTIVKMVFFRYGSDTAAAATICAITIACCLLHVYAARQTVEQARRRYALGLVGLGLPWEEGEEAWMVLRRADLESSCRNEAGPPDQFEDVPAESLADEDSKFVEVMGMKVHYKEASPAHAARRDSVGIMLLHGFGGGVFSWRHVLEPLATQCQCRVVAMDRPGFGLTSRPRVSDGSYLNPYSQGSQAQLVLATCAALGLQQVVLVGHGDGCLLLLRAAATAAVCRSEVEACSRRPASVAPSSCHAHPPAVPVVLARQDSNCSSSSLDAVLHPDPTSPPPAVSSSEALGGSTASTDTRPSHSRSASTSGPCTGSVAMLSSATDVPRDGVACADVAAEVEGSWSGLDQASTPPPTTSPAVPVTRISRHHSAASSTTFDRCDLPVAERPASASAALSAICCTPPPHCQCTPEIMTPTSGPDANVPAVLGVVLLHPNLSGQMGTALSRLLARAKLGRTIFRPLLRIEVGEVSNRRAWHNVDKLTSDVIELYKAPLRVEGWDLALMETTRVKRDVNTAEVSAYFANIRQLPALVLTGQYDKIVPPAKLEQLCHELPCSRLAIVPDCGHLSHEESPADLLHQLAPFCAGLLPAMSRMRSCGGSTY